MGTPIVRKIAALDAAHGSAAGRAERYGRRDSGKIRCVRIVASVASTLIVLLYAAGSGLWVSSGDAWYRSLQRPPWQPPDFVFGLIWPYNFAVLIAAGIAVALTGSAAGVWVWLGSLCVSVIAALSWAWLFYLANQPWPAAVALTVAAVTTIPVVVSAWRAQTWAGVLLLPYLVWIFVATSLAYGYAIRN
ncbi:MAG: TspO/MBR family protein [Actinomycetes bacterium]